MRISIGSVLPHLQAGFGGGYKLILPGTSHGSTLGALHRQGLGRGATPAGCSAATAAENPMRRAIRRGGGTVGSVLLDQPPAWRARGRFSRSAAGHPDAGAGPPRGRGPAALRGPGAAPADLVVAGNHPWPGDPMQSFKVLLQHRAACRKGGVLVGFFWTDPTEIDRSFPMPVLRAIAASGALGLGRSAMAWQWPTGVAALWQSRARS